MSQEETSQLALQTDSQNPATEKKKRIKSYVLRQGRMSKAQTDALENLWAVYGLEPTGDKLDFAQVFGRNSAVFLEIGFGMGDSLVQMAQANPAQDYIGIEVHRPGVGALLKKAEEAGVTNLKVFNFDAIDVLANKIPLASLAGVFLFFPDPWHKAKHKKRRLVQPPFVEMIAKYLAPAGKFHLATDWEDYALQMMEVLSESKSFANDAGENNYTTRPGYRPLTKFEQRGHRLGHGVWDLIFSKQN